MKKLTLRVEELEVESYLTEKEEEGVEGTVEAQSLPTNPLCTQGGCPTKTCTGDWCC